jgi:hypothetical protein
MRDFSDDAMPGLGYNSEYRREPGSEWNELHIPVYAVTGLKQECIVTLYRVRDMPQNGMTFEEFKSRNPHPADKSRCGSGHCPHCRCRLNLESAFDMGATRVRVLPLS